MGGRCSLLAEPVRRNKSIRAGAEITSKQKTLGAGCRPPARWELLSWAKQYLLCSAVCDSMQDLKTRYKIQAKWGSGSGWKKGKQKERKRKERKEEEKKKKKKKKRGRGRKGRTQ